MKRSEVKKTKKRNKKNWLKQRKKNERWASQKIWVERSSKKSSDGTADRHFEKNVFFSHKNCKNEFLISLAAVATDQVSRLHESLLARARAWLARRENERNEWKKWKKKHTNSQGNDYFVLQPKISPSLYPFKTIDSQIKTNKERQTYRQKELGKEVYQRIEAWLVIIYIYI